MKFQDDGGTRAWRANQATWNTIEPPPRGIRQRWKRLSFLDQLVLLLGLLAAPWIVLIGLLIFWAICGC